MENPPLQPQGATPTPPASPSAAKPYASAAKPYPGSDAAQSSGNGRGWILALAILQIIGGIILFAMSRDTMEPLAAIIMLVIVLGLAVIYFGLWFWAKKSPFPALLTTLIVFLTFHLLDAVFDPASLFRGIIVKIVLVAGLATAVKKAYVKKREAELDATQSP